MTRSVTPSPALGAFAALGRSRSSRYFLRYLGDPALRVVAAPLPNAAELPLELIHVMSDVCHVHRGLGISAPQVGGDQRIILAQVAGEMLLFLNPEITDRSAEKVTAPEGCLSVPGMWPSKVRHRAITVRYLNEKREPQTLRLVDVEARIVQHELDHLDGILIVDGLTRQQRRQAERLAEKARG